LYSVLPFQQYKDTNNSSGDQLSGKKNKKLLGLPICVFVPIFMV
jgi:hypothetical protein